MDLIQLLNKLYDGGVVTEASLLLLIAGILIFGFRRYIAPMHKRVMDSPTCEDIKSIGEQNSAAEREALQELLQKLQTVYDHLETIEDFDKDSSRDIKELYEVVKEIKTMLNQFQGHMMYSNSRRSTDFGNRELK